MDTDQIELKILKSFFQNLDSENIFDNTISDSKLIKETKKQLKIALREASDKCTCCKLKYDICEVCQASPAELYHLRHFFHFMRDAKKHQYTLDEIKERIEYARSELTK